MQIKMTAGLSGPDFSLSPGESRSFDEIEGQRLIDAGFAELDDDAEAAEDGASSTGTARGGKA